MPTPREIMENALRGKQPGAGQAGAKQAGAGRDRVSTAGRASSRTPSASRPSSKRVADAGQAGARQAGAGQAGARQAGAGQAAGAGRAGAGRDRVSTAGRVSSRTPSASRPSSRRAAGTGQPGARPSAGAEQAGAQPSAGAPSGRPSLNAAAATRPSPKNARSFITRWRMFGVAAFSVLMIFGGVVGLLFFARPTTSAVEMRNLTTFPEFTVNSFLNGSFFTDVSLWYADTYPLREPMVAADHTIDGLFGVNTGTGMVGGNVKADEIPVESDKNKDGNGSGGESGNGENKQADFVPVEPTDPPDEHAVDADIQANIMSGVYIKDGAGYGVYYFSQNAADTYITAMNTAAEKLDGVSTVYSIMAPSNSICLPEDEANSVGGSDQQQTLDYLKSRFDSRVKQVNLIDTLKEHRDDYTYFHTDHHWTQLGAYYGYVEFCKAKGIEPKSLGDWKQVNLGALQGSYTDALQSMGFIGSDEVEAYIPSSTNEMTIWTADGQEVEGSVIDESATDWDPSYKYMAFISGDRPLEIIRNPELSDGSSCLVVKDSYGCTFVPCLVDSYETVYVIDFRETDKNICDYAKENNIQDVIFLTNIKIGLTDTVAQTLLSEVS